MNRKTLYAAAALLLLFSACDLAGPKPPAGGPEGKAAVRVAVAASGAPGRTVPPAVGLGDVTAWELWGGKPLGPQSLITKLSGTGGTVYLESGVWDFTVKGSKDGAVILQGILTEQTITLGGPNTLNFSAAPHKDGEGSFKITITLPEGHGITRAEVWKDDLKVDELTPVNNPLVFEEECAAGDYYYSIRLYKDAVLYGAVSETAQVRANLLSAAKYTLTAEDLNMVYRIDYHVNGGGLAAANPGFYRSTDAGFTLPEPTYGVFKFEGWYDNEDFGGGPVEKIDQGGKEDKEFWARWSAPAVFHSVGGSTPPPTQYVLLGGKVDDPGSVSKTAEGMYLGTIADAGDLDLSFLGWYDDPEYNEPAYNFTAPVTGPLDLYAKWPQSVVDIAGQEGATMLNKALAYINGLTLDGETSFTIVLEDGWSMGEVAEQKTVSINQANAVVTLVGKGPDPTEIVGSPDAVAFTISKGTLILDKNITIKGLTTSSPLVRVNFGGTLIMQEGAKITGNGNNGGVEVDGGSFTMDGGEISKNIGSSGSGNGGGVVVNNGGSFTMNNGEISGNTRNGNGGGVLVSGSGSSFTMKNGKISSNTGTAGGGVYVTGSFIMKGGEISGNSSEWGGGGVFVSSSASFSKTGNSFIGGDTDHIAYKDNNENGNPTDNTAKQSVANGHAVWYDGVGKYRNAPLASGEDISTDNLSANWEN